MRHNFDFLPGLTVDSARKTITLGVIRQMVDTPDRIRGHGRQGWRTARGVNGFHNRSNTGRTGDNRTQPAEAVVSYLGVGRG
jgi:hypothetical protein